jgi:hypothetical protein
LKRDVVLIARDGVERLAEDVGPDGAAQLRIQEGPLARQWTAIAEARCARKGNVDPARVLDVPAEKATGEAAIGQ